MIIIGAKGFAKEVLEIFHKNKNLDNLYFYDDVSNDIDNYLYDKFEILKDINSVKKIFEKVDNKFTIGIGNPILRYKLYQKFSEIGGEFTSSISPYAKIGSFGTEIQKGCNIMTNSILTNDIKIGKGCLINLSCTIGHDSILEDFVELCPDVNISGNCKIGKFTFIGTNSTILPNITIGQNVVIAAGSVVTKDVPSNCMIAGVPAIIKKEIKPLEL